jgi:hypothetical protein
MKLVQVYVPQEMIQRIKDKCPERRGLSAFIRDAVSEKLAQSEKD